MLASIFGFLSAGFWLWSSFANVQASTWADLGKLDGRLRKAARINAVAAGFAALTVLASALHK